MVIDNKQDKWAVKNSMRYLQYYPTDVINGEGTRCVLFVSGCEHACRGCYNAKSWNFKNGVEYDATMEEQILKDLKDTRINRQGLTLSGGDPFHPLNAPTLTKLAKRVRSECPNKDIWAWTGYKLDQLVGVQQELLRYVDVLIDGKFVQDLADPSLLWRGSSNQVIHRFIRTVSC